MSDISNQLIKDSYNYVLQSDTTTGVVYRIGGTIPVNPTFQSGLTVTGGFTYSGAGEQVGYVMTCDALGNATWSPVSAATPSSGVTSITVGNGLSADTSTGAVTIVFTGQTGGDYLPLSGGTVTGGTIFQSGLTANTISATTYQNYPGSSDQYCVPTLYVSQISGCSPVTILTELRVISGLIVTGNTEFKGSVTMAQGITITGNTTISGLTANTFYSSGQVGIGTSNPNAAAIIEIASTTQGVLFPRMTKVQRDAITSPPIGLMLFVTDDNEGLYIYKTSGWVQII